MAEHAMESRGTEFEILRSARRAGTARRLIASLLLAIFTTVAFSPSALAVEHTAARKVGRGFANVTLGVLAIPGEVVQRMRTSGPGLGIAVGIPLGIGKFIAHEAVGVWEILTCPFEWPPNFRPILNPEFPWEYFTERSRYNKSEDDW